MTSDFMEDLRAMKAKGRTVKDETPQKHPGSKSGQNWEPDQATKDRLGDSYKVVKEIIEEP